VASPARENPGEEERFTGCLIGLAVGDALGAPVEGIKDGHIQQIFGEVTDYADSIAAFPDRPGKWRLKGLYTDDTQQALAVADVLATHGCADVEALAEIYLRMADEGPLGADFGAHRGIGPGFRRAVEAMRQKGDPRLCGQPSAGNGAAMRIAPVGLYYAGDDDGLARAAIEISLMTHSDPRGIAAALAVARAVGWFALGDASPVGPDPASVAKALGEWLREWEERLVRDYRKYLGGVRPGDERTHHFSQALASLPSLLRESNDRLAAETIVRQANACGPEQPVAQTQNSFALASVVTALYRALAGRSFANIALGVVNVGADADTAGAIAGAIAGARFGEAAIPRQWVSGLLNADQVRLRATALCRREIDWAQWQDLVEMEKALTLRERETIARAEAEHRRLIEKRQERLDERRARAAKTASAGAAGAPGFAPPPEIWLRGGTPESRAEIDPEQAKKEKSLRGRKRIDWKEGRRQKKKW
jgi:ADP-ribosylglycohydrolase